MDFFKKIFSLSYFIFLKSTLFFFGTSNMEICSITRDKFKYLRKHRINLETRFNLKIILPETFNHSVTLANGTKENMNKLKNLFQKEIQHTNADEQQSTEILMITLSDSEGESHEVPKSKKNEIKCNKSMVASTPVAVQKINSSQSPKKTPDSSNLAKRELILQHSNFVPLTVTSLEKGKRFVKMKKKKIQRSIPKTSNQPINDSPFSSLINQHTQLCLSLSKARQDSSPNLAFPCVSTNMLSSTVAPSTSTLNSTVKASLSTITNPFCLTVSSKSFTATSATVNDTFSSEQESTSTISSSSVGIPLCAKISDYQIMSEDEDCVILDEDSSSSLQLNDISVIVLDDGVAEKAVTNHSNSAASKATQDKSAVVKEIDDSIIVLDEDNDVIPVPCTSMKEIDDSIIILDEGNDVIPVPSTSSSQKFSIKAKRKHTPNCLKTLKENDVNKSSGGHWINTNGHFQNEENFIPLNNFNNVRPSNFNQLQQSNNFMAVNVNLNGAFNSAFRGYSQSNSSCVSLDNFNFPEGKNINSFPEPNYSAVVLRPLKVSLRPIVIDGSNVAREHGKPTETFSCKGIQISIQYFLERGHTKVTAFIPKFRRHQTYGPFPTTDGEILDQLEKRKHLIYSPSRRVEGRLMSCYDDRFIVQLATQNGGVILSNDNYKDIMLENEEFRQTIKERLLMFCFVDDLLMIPEDPLGRHGPRLYQFLQFPP